MPGARSKFGASMFETEVFRKQIYCVEESTCDIFGTFIRPPQRFGAPAVIWRNHGGSAPGKLCPRYAPVLTCRIHSLWLRERHNTFVILVLVFILSDAADEDRSSAC